MKAYATDGFGEPGTIRDLPTPEPERGQIRVRVAAAGVNPVDNVVLQGFMKNMMEHRFPLVPGVDASGIIDALGDGVETWSVGDEVFGAVGKMFFGEGTYAEHTTMSAGSIAHRPSSVAHESAAAIPTAGVTALTVLDALDAKKGAVVLALGAAGGVGSYFLQLAVQREVHVIAVTRSENAAYVRSLGAEDVIDYTAENVGDALAARYESGIDGIADMVGDKEELASAVAGVKPGGRVASSVGTAEETDLAKRNLVGQNVMTAVTTERLEVLASSRSAGQLRDPEIATMPLDQASDALARIAGRHVRGKLVLQVK